MLKYKSGQLDSLLQGFQQHHKSGTAYVQPVTDTLEDQVFVWQDGRITYAGPTIPTPQKFIEAISKYLHRNSLQSAADLAITHGANPRSICEILDFMIGLGFLQWADIKNYIQSRVVTSLEPLMLYPGTLQFQAESFFELTSPEHYQGLELDGLFHEITQRQQQWETLTPAIPGMNAVPRIKDWDTISEPAARRHLQTWVDGSRSILKIATQLNRDALQLAKLYTKWVEAGWIECQLVQNPVSPPSPLPIVLSVDDSPIVQTLIKRALVEHYQVHLANNAVDALNILNQGSVRLLLLDVTMPDIDGLEFCRTLRAIRKFEKLPIVMLTAKDGYLNKLKGQFAGSTHYLTKPIDPDKLLKIVQKYIKAEDT